METLLRELSGSDDQENNSGNDIARSLEGLYGEQREEKIREELTKMFEEYQDKLLRMIDIRLRQEIRGQVEPNDILQESFIEACRQLRTSVSMPKNSALVWLRLIVGQQLIMFHRRYFQTQKRNVAREISIYGGSSSPQSDVLSMSGFLVGKLTSPSVAARRQEMIGMIRVCLDELNEGDREILSLRHFEQLSNAETAEELQISPNTASVRYMRALKKFKEILVHHHIDELIE